MAIYTDLSPVIRGPVGQAYLVPGTTKFGPADDIDTYLSWSALERLDIVLAGGTVARIDDNPAGLHRSQFNGGVLAPELGPGNVSGRTGVLNIVDSAGTVIATIDVNKLTVSKRFGLTKGADLTAAASLALGTDGNVFTVNGNTNIDFLDDTHPGPIILWFTGTPTLNNNTGSPPANRKALKVTGGANLALSANDVVAFFQDGTCWRQIATKHNSGA